MEGERKGFKATLPETVDVRGLRKRLRLSQGRFADRFGLSVDAVRHWESGRRHRKPLRARFLSSLPPTLNLLCVPWLKVRDRESFRTQAAEVLRPWTRDGRRARNRIPGFFRPRIPLLKSIFVFGGREV